MTIKRCNENPLIVPVDVVPSRPDFKVDGIFNCGVAEYKGEILLLCRVAESVATDDPDVVKIPIVKKENDMDQIEVITIKKDEHPEYIFHDPRKVGKLVKGVEKTVYLTSLSHLRLARSQDGVHFTLDTEPFVFPNAEEESWGMEDPRITQIGDTYYINYTSVTGHGPATSLISTQDFENFERHGVIFAPENKDVAIFPEKIGGSYVAFNRPVPCGIGDPEMWIARSPDLLHWGEQKHFCGISDTDKDRWDNGRVGGGAVPFRTEKGFVEIYHAADQNDRYHLGAFLLDAKHPEKVIGRTNEPILSPETDYEKEGFFGNVVFSCGCILKDGNVIIYYGAADDKICRADIPLEEIYKAMGL